MSQLQQARLEAIVNQARQRVSEFERRLDRLAALSQDGQRKFINKTGSQSRTTPSRDLEHRLMLYGRRRLGTVAREMVLLHEMKRCGALTARTHIACKGAFWQAFQGTVEQPACHTSPGLLLLDGLLPTIPVPNVTIKRHLVVVFGDCMLMPVAVNKLDSWLDETMGWAALVEAAEGVVQGARPTEAVAIYIDAMREAYASVLDLTPHELALASTGPLLSPTRTELIVEEAYQTAYDALLAHDEVLMHGPPTHEIQNYQAEIRQEAGIASNETAPRFVE